MIDNAQAIGANDDSPASQAADEVAQGVFLSQWRQQSSRAFHQKNVATMSKAKRTGKIFVDYFRNDYTATAIADYSARARPGIPVAVPLDWKQLSSLKAANQFTLDDVLKRVKGKKTDPFSKSKAQTIPQT